MRRVIISMFLILGVLFMLVSGGMIPPIIYSVTTEADKLLYGGIVAFIISFFVLGVGLLVFGIKDMKKQNHEKEGQGKY